MGYQRDSHVNYARFNGFSQFSKLIKNATDVSAQRKFSEDII